MAYKKQIKRKVILFAISSLLFIVSAASVYLAVNQTIEEIEIQGFSALPGGVALIAHSPEVTREAETITAQLAGLASSSLTTLGAKAEIEYDGEVPEHVRVRARAILIALFKGLYEVTGFEAAPEGITKIHTKVRGGEGRITFHMLPDGENLFVGAMLNIRQISPRLAQGLTNNIQPNKQVQSRPATPSASKEKPLASEVQGNSDTEEQQASENTQKPTQLEDLLPTAAQASVLTDGIPTHNLVESQLEKLDFVRVGTSSKTIWVFEDPLCPACEQANRMLWPFIESGQLSVNYLMLNFIGKDKATKMQGYRKSLIMQMLRDLPMAERMRYAKRITTDRSSDPLAILIELAGIDSNKPNFKERLSTALKLAHMAHGPKLKKVNDVFFTLPARFRATPLFVNQNPSGDVLTFSKDWVIKYLEEIE